jgi:hypothetical protein
MLPLPEGEDATMLRAGNVDGENGDDLLIASSAEAWFYASAPANVDDPTLTLELAVGFPMTNLVNVEIGDFGGSSELDVWLQGTSSGELHLGEGGFAFADPLSFDLNLASAWAVGDFDLAGRDDLVGDASIWLGADMPAWTSPSVILDAPPWIGSFAQAKPLAIPDGLAIAWTIDIGTGSWPEDEHVLHTAVARYPELGAPSADAVLYRGRPARLIGPADVVDQGWIAIDGGEIVVYRELDGQHCRAATSGNGVYVDGHLDPTDTNRMLLLTADGAVEEWLRL